MAEIVKLKSRRKQAARVAADQQAQQNRILHGRTKAERLRDEMQAAREAKARANAKLER